MSTTNHFDRTRAQWGRASGLLTVLLLAAGCATTGTSQLLSDQGSLPPGIDEEVLEGGAIAEATLALSRVWSVAGPIHQVGSRLTFSFWSERGALTLTGFTASGRGGPSGEAIDDETFQQEVAHVLTRFAQRHLGQVHLTLERQQARWNLSYSTSAAARPPEAKTLPVRRAGLHASEVLPLAQAVRQLMGAVQVPSGTQAHLAVDIFFEDGRTEGGQLRLFEVTRPGSHGPPRPIASVVMEESIAVLLPFTQALGERTVHLELRLAAHHDSSYAHGWVEQAAVERPSTPAQLDHAFVSEYRTLHEDILRRWREESREAGVWIAHKGAEEVASWYVGGILTRGLGWLGGRLAPTVLRALQRGGEAATGWLRTTLTRLPQEKRLAFERLWTKVQLEGKKSLSSTERHELRSLMEELERLIHTPLDRNTKARLRERAREAYSNLHPEFAELLRTQQSLLPIHHRRPLEYAQLFPEDNINASENLIMVTREVHERVNALWTRFRQIRPSPTAQDVEAVARIVDRQFQPWYHQPGSPPRAPYALQEAADTALAQLQRLFPA